MLYACRMQKVHWFWNCWNTVDPWTTWGLGGGYWLVSYGIVHTTYLWFLHIHGSTSVDSANCRSYAAAKSRKSCPTLCDPIDGSLPGSPAPGIFQARTLEWVAISFSNAWKWKVKVKSLSCVRLLVTPWTAAYQATPSMRFSKQEYWSGSHIVLWYSLLKKKPAYKWICTVQTHVVEHQL